MVSYDTDFLNDKVQAEADKVYVNANGEPRGLFFPVQPFHDIHFNAENLFEAGTTGNLLFTRILMAVGLVIIAIACINFSILYTSKSLSMAKEIGIRKTLGSSHGAIATRLLAESCLLSVLCTVLAIGTAELLLQSVVKAHLYEAELSILSSTRAYRDYSADRSHFRASFRLLCRFKICLLQFFTDPERKA